MTFVVRDLMVDVLPATDADVHELYLCAPITGGGQPKPGPKPKPEPHPKPKPECQPISTTGPGGFAEDFLVAGAELAALAVLREELRQTLPR
jgi:hypothetical protein